MMIHDRYFITSQASAKFFLKVDEAFEKESTYHEIIGILARVLMEESINHSINLDESNAYKKVKSILQKSKEEDSLTHGEISAMISNIISTMSKYEIRIERHGNSEKSGDEK